ncbi:MAG: fumarylacetoacetate hydrolase family protein [Pseudomonadota bacterium]
MSAYVVPQPPQPTLPVAGTSDLFPVRRVYCVGRNYAEHAREMGHDPDREPPFFFQKNPDALSTAPTFPYPPASEDVHFEIELVAALGMGGTDIAEDAALEHVFGYALALDMTRRDLQGTAKKMGRPWEIGKSFEASAPCTALTPAADIGHPTRGEIWLNVNDERRQTGDLNQMIWSLPEQISYLSRLFTLAPGDIILTGTPAGVGPVARGDNLHGHVSPDGNADAIADLKVSVV